MKLATYLIIVIVAFCLTQAGSEKAEIVALNNTNLVDTINIGCLGTYDLNPLDTSEKINQVYDKQKIKHGHWISFGVSVTKTANEKVIRTKLEEGYYRYNMKVGFWKFYNQDGSLKDSIEYKNDIAVINS